MKKTLLIFAMALFMSQKTMATGEYSSSSADSSSDCCCDDGGSNATLYMAGAALFIASAHVCVSAWTPMTKCFKGVYDYYRNRRNGDEEAGFESEVEPDPLQTLRDEVKDLTNKLQVIRERAVDCDVFNEQITGVKAHYENVLGVVEGYLKERLSVLDQKTDKLNDETKKIDVSFACEWGKITEQFNYLSQQIQQLSSEDRQRVVEIVEAMRRDNQEKNQQFLQIFKDIHVLFDNQENKED
jgi:hypothetical protein